MTEGKEVYLKVGNEVMTALSSCDFDLTKSLELNNNNHILDGLPGKSFTITYNPNKEKETVTLNMQCYLIIKNAIYFRKDLVVVKCEFLESDINYLKKQGLKSGYKNGMNVYLTFNIEL